MILASGAFDGVHAGHVRYLRAAQRLGRGEEDLVCAVAPDAYIRETKQREPRWTHAHRVETLSAIGWIHTLTQLEPSVAATIRRFRPRLFVKGDDWTGRLPADVLAACAETGCEVAYVHTPGVHVSETLTTDEDALARFEQIVLTQQSAVVPWQPVTPYDFESRTVIEGKHPDLIIETFGKGPVLDYGCGPDAILVRLLRDRGVMAYGIDPILDEPWRCLQPRYDSGPEEFVGHFPVVICREVFEHLCVREIQPLLRRFLSFTPTFVYVTTRFAKAPDSLLSVDTSDDLDQTHISMLNQTFLRALFVLEGFKRRADLEQAMDWKHLGRVLVYERT
jgi:glycerol-3-phosphate cytidylyltransferase-like family protein